MMGTRIFVNIQFSCDACGAPQVLTETIAAGRSWEVWAHRCEECGLRQTVRVQFGDRAPEIIKKKQAKHLGRGTL